MDVWCERYNRLDDLVQIVLNPATPLGLPRWLAFFALLAARIRVDAEQGFGWMRKSCKNLNPPGKLRWGLLNVGNRP